jgi:hypothetical protein
LVLPENERNGPVTMRQQVMQQVQMWPVAFMRNLIRDPGLCAKRFVWGQGRMPAARIFGPV